MTRFAADLEIGGASYRGEHGYGVGYVGLRRNFTNFAVVPDDHGQTALTKLSALLFRRALMLVCDASHSGICFSGIGFSPLREIFILSEELPEIDDRMTGRMGCVAAAPDARTI